MITRYKLFTAPTCPNCPSVKAYMLSRMELEGEVVEVSPQNQQGFALARQFQVTSVPTVIFLDESGDVVARAGTVENINAVIGQKEVLTAS